MAPSSTFQLVGAASAPVAERFAVEYHGVAFFVDRIVADVHLSLVGYLIFAAFCLFGYGSGVFFARAFATSALALLVVAA